MTRIRKILKSYKKQFKLLKGGLNPLKFKNENINTNINEQKIIFLKKDKIYVNKDDYIIGSGISEKLKLDDAYMIHGTLFSIKKLRTIIGLAISKKNYPIITINDIDREIPFMDIYKLYRVWGDFITPDSNLKANELERIQKFNKLLLSYELKETEDEDDANEEKIDKYLANLYERKEENIEEKLENYIKQLFEDKKIKLQEYLKNLFKQNEQFIITPEELNISTTSSHANNINTDNIIILSDGEINENLLVDQDGFILDEEGVRIDDLISLAPIKFKDAIIINSNIYDINQIRLYISRKITKKEILKPPSVNEEGIEISFYDIYKIYRLKGKFTISPEETTHIESDRLNKYNEILDIYFQNRFKSNFIEILKKYFRNYSTYLKFPNTLDNPPEVFRIIANEPPIKL